MHERVLPELSLEDANAVFDDIFQTRETLRDELRASTGAAITSHSIKVLNDERRLRAEALAEKTEKVINNSFVLEKFDDEFLNIGPDYLNGEKASVFSWASPIGVQVGEASPLKPDGILGKTFYKCSPNSNVVVALNFEVWDEAFRAEVEAEVEEFADELEVDEEVAAENVLAQRDEGLQVELKSARLGNIPDIIKTLQPSQMALITRPFTEPLLIQGGPGCGKTVVALHRLEYLLHADNEIDPKPRNVLIVGPTESYVRHLKGSSKRLANFGAEVSIRSASNLAAGRWKWSNDAVAPEIHEIKSHPEFLSFLDRALENEVRVPIEGITHLKHTVTCDDLRSFVSIAFKFGTWNASRSRFLELVKESCERNGMPDAAVAAIVKKSGASLWPKLKPDSFLRALFSSHQKIVDACLDSYSVHFVKSIYRSSKLKPYLFDESDLTLLAYLETKIDGIQPFDFVLVDEAQDLNEQQCQILRSLVKDNNVTLVGDEAQTVLPNAVSGWNRLTELLVKQSSEGDIKWNRVNLVNTYRLPSALTNFIEQENILENLLGENAPRLISVKQDLGSIEEEPIGIVGKSGIPNSLRHRVQAHYDARKSGSVRSLAVITTLENKTRLERILKERGFVDPIYTPIEAKGLEFDTVIVIDPKAMKNSGRNGLNEYFVAVTRASNHLIILS